MTSDVTVCKEYDLCWLADSDGESDSCDLDCGMVIVFESCSSDADVDAESEWERDQTSCEGDGDALKESVRLPTALVTDDVVEGCAVRCDRDSVNEGLSDGLELSDEEKDVDCEGVPLLVFDMESDGESDNVGESVGDNVSVGDGVSELDSEVVDEGLNVPRELVRTCECVFLVSDVVSVGESLLAGV